ncbi:MAG: ATP-binding protein [Acidobacteriota bacterium]
MAVDQETGLVERVDSLLADPVERECLKRQADREAARWSLPGVPAYVLALGLVGVGTDLPKDLPGFFWGLMTVSVVLAMLRGWWLLRFDRLYERHVIRWRWGFAMQLHLAGAMLGMAAMMSVLRYDITSDSLLAMLIVGFFASASIFVYHHDRSLFLIYCAALVLPTLGALVVVDSRAGVVLVIGGSLYLTYLVVQGLANHRQRWQFLARGRLLELHAVALGEARDAADRAREAADEANRAKTRFLAQMSHELRTPLTSIVGLSEQLDQPLVSLDERRRMVAAMHDAADLLLSLIDDVLDLARSEDGSIALRPAPLEPRAMVDSLVALFHPRAVQQGVALTGAVDEAVPARVTGDAGRLRQVLINLIGNALKHTEATTIDVRVDRVETRDDGEVALRFQVRDDGKGVDPELAAQIFEPFVQGVARVGDGVGLGLSICRRIVMAMGGELALDSVAGGGSVFSFVVLLPLADAGCESRERTEPDDSVTVTARGEILVVEDNEFNRTLFLQQLEMLGRRSVAVSSGEEALEEVANRAYGLILLDCMMPGIDGYETARRLRLLEERRERSRTPIVAVTANAFPDDQQRCLAAGMDDWLTKPFRMHELAAKVDQWLLAEPVRHSVGG